MHDNGYDEKRDCDADSCPAELPDGSEERGLLLLLLPIFVLLVLNLLLPDPLESLGVGLGPIALRDCLQVHLGQSGAVGLDQEPVQPSHSQVAEETGVLEGEILAFSAEEEEEEERNGC